MAVLTKITTRTLADNSVTAAKIQADTIVAGDLAPNSVTASELADDAVDTAAIADDAVTNASIADGAIDTAAKIADDAITGGKLANDIAISTTGNIATTGTGTITAGGAATLNDGLKQPASKAVTGTLAAKQMLTADAYSLTGDLTVNSEVKMGSIASDTDVVLMSDSTSANRTVTGTGTLEIGSVSSSTQTQESNVIAGGLTANADIDDALDTALEARNMKRNVVVTYVRNRNGKRTTMSTTGAAHVWPNAIVINRKYSDTSILVQGQLIGHDKHSYPAYFLYGQLICPNGTSLKRYEGNWYGGNYAANQSIMWSVDMLFNSGELQGEIGDFKFNCGWDHVEGSVGRPFVTWNPNASDDTRGWQQHSVMNAWELYERSMYGHGNKRNDSN